jgi:hypothetical protein
MGRRNRIKVRLGEGMEGSYGFRTLGIPGWEPENPGTWGNERRLAPCHDRSIKMRAMPIKRT